MEGFYENMKRGSPQVYRSLSAYVRDRLLQENGMEPHALLFELRQIDFQARKILMQLQRVKDFDRKTEMISQVEEIRKSVKDLIGEVDGNY